MHAPLVVIVVRDWFSTLTLIMLFTSLYRHLTSNLAAQIFITNCLFIFIKVSTKNLFDVLHHLESKILATETFPRRKNLWLM